MIAGTVVLVLAVAVLLTWRIQGVSKEVLRSATCSASTATATAPLDSLSEPDVAASEGEAGAGPVFSSTRPAANVASSPTNRGGDDSRGRR